MTITRAMYGVIFSSLWQNDMVECAFWPWGRFTSRGNMRHSPKLLSVINCTPTALLNQYFSVENPVLPNSHEPSLTFTKCTNIDTSSDIHGFPCAQLSLNPETALRSAHTVYSYPVCQANAFKKMKQLCRHQRVLGHIIPDEVCDQPLQISLP